MSDLAFVWGICEKCGKVRTEETYCQVPKICSVCLEKWQSENGIVESKLTLIISVTELCGIDDDKRDKEDSLIGKGPLYEKLLLEDYENLHRLEPKKEKKNE